MSAIRRAVGNSISPESHSTMLLVNLVLVVFGMVVTLLGLAWGVGLAAGMVAPEVKAVGIVSGSLLCGVGLVLVWLGFRGASLKRRA